jgi:hypothetical protein
MDVLFSVVLIQILLILIKFVMKNINFYDIKEINYENTFHNNLISLFDAVNTFL